MRIRLLGSRFLLLRRVRGIIRYKLATARRKGIVLIGRCVGGVLVLLVGETMS